MHPKHVTSRGIKAGAFRPPAGLDEISVTRIDYSSLDFCRKYGIDKLQTDKYKYLGFGVLLTGQIRNLEADVVFSPKFDNFAHADIKIGFIPQKGEPLPSKYIIICNNLAKKARRYDDPNPNLSTLTIDDLH